MSFSKTFDVVIVGSLLDSNEHYYVLLIVLDHFELRPLYVHTLFSNSSDQSSITKSISLGKTFRENPDDPDLCRIIWSKPSASFRMIRPLPETSPDDPAPARIIRPWQFNYIKAAARGGTSKPYFFSLPPPTLVPK